MANNQEMYCKHCKKYTVFLLESDWRWYCDECGNAYGSIPSERMGEEDYFEDDGQIEYEDYDAGKIVMCPLCNNLIEIDELIDGCLCPVCLEDLSDQLKDNEEL